MADRITVGDLSGVIARTLDSYGDDVTRRVNAASKAAAKELVQLTEATAPLLTGSFAANIAMKKVETRHGCDTYAWYVKPPKHRLAHLLVHGHATANGGRVPGDPFLHNAWNTVRQKFEQEVEDACK